MIQQQNLTINFSGDLDTKTDVHQVAPNNFIGFNNAVRTTGGLFKKRNGYQDILAGTAPFATNLATLRGDLVKIGQNVTLFSDTNNDSYNAGQFQPIDLSVIQAIRNSSTQGEPDIAISNGLACVVANDSQYGAIYTVIEENTGNTIIPITPLLPATTYYADHPRVVVLGLYFIITYTNTNDGTLHYRSVLISSPTTTTTGTLGNADDYDITVNSNIMYFVYNTIAGGASFELNTLSSSLVLGTAVPYSAGVLNPFRLGISVGALVWVTWTHYNSGASTDTVYLAAFTTAFVNTVPTITVDTISSPSEAYATTVLAGASGVELIYSSSVTITFTISAMIFKVYNNSGTNTFTQSVSQGLQLASKPFIVNGNSYVWGAFTSTYQPTYFLMQTGVGSAGVIVARLASQNAGIDLEPPSVLSNVIVSGETARFAYLYKDQLFSLNKSLGVNLTNTATGIYAQSGVNVNAVTFNASNILASEIAGSLQMSGGFLWMFDGSNLVEQNFHTYPEDLMAANQPGGSMSADTYFYQVTYEWTDAVGNIHRSSPSIPVSITLSGTGTQTSVNLQIPYLWLTAKVLPNPVRLVVYRYSSKNPVFTQVSSLTDTTAANNALIINDPTGTVIQFNDTLDYTSIQGNNPLYTNGGVLEDTPAPASSILALFDTRLWLVDAEDPNLLWFSKQVIENTPVEMTNLQTFYVAPTTSSQAATGPITGLAAMDDKLIIFKGDSNYQNAIYYINGAGPDITGANNQYSQPIFITSAVGCNNQQSIVLTPIGIMFQTSQGIWLLGRDLGTEYIGAPVEAYNANTVTSAVSVEGTTQVRFTLNTGTELTYDYFFKKWQTASTIPAISSVIYQGLHTYLDSSGNVFQETPGAYLDGAAPVNMSWTTPWYNLAGLQGYERAYFFDLLGTYISPHILTVNVYYDYNSTTVAETFTITPNNVAGGTTFEQWRMKFSRQKCIAFMLQVTESYDATKGLPAGAGLSVSGIDIIFGANKGYRPIPAANTVGTK